jgi:plastocyanin
MACARFFPTSVGQKRAHAISSTNSIALPDWQQFAIFKECPLFKDAAFRPKTNSSGDNIIPRRFSEGTPMFKKLLFGMIGFALLSVLFTACTIRDEANTPTGPQVKMGPSNFVQATVTIKKGQPVTLVNVSSAEHIIDNGEWKGATQDPTQEPGAPKVALTVQGNGSATTAPFNTAGTFHLYCTIHGGMNLTVTVQ